MTALNYIYLLILVFLILVYYKGFSSFITDAGNVAAKMIAYLQGR